jgi:hypothetical protein
MVRVEGEMGERDKVYRKALVDMVSIPSQRKGVAVLAPKEGSVPLFAHKHNKVLLR